MTALSRTVVIVGKTMLTPTICRFVFADAQGRDLPIFTVGSHIVVRTPNGMARSYSLTDSPSVLDRYAISVAREGNGRGGSRSLIDDARLGDEIQISEPSNAFRLTEAADYLLIAGGIGITPIRGMLHELLAAGHQSVRLIYLTRDADEAAYLDELHDPAIASAIVVHHSRNAGRLDLWPFLAEPGNTHIYCCGSETLMNEVKALTFHWNPRALHFEDFAGVAPAQIGDEPFEVVWAPSRRSMTVAAGASLLDTLRENGIGVASSCNSGTCGTCRLSLVKGTAEHRDLVLSPDEQSRYVMPCVSRSKHSEVLEVGPARAREQ